MGGLRVTTWRRTCNRHTVPEVVSRSHRCPRSSRPMSLAPERFCQIRNSDNEKSLLASRRSVSEDERTFPRTQNRSKGNPVLFDLSPAQILWVPQSPLFPSHPCESSLLSRPGLLPVLLNSGLFFGEAKVTIDHHLDKLCEGYCWAPSQSRACFRGVTAQVIDLRGSKIARICLQELSVIETCVSERDLTEFPDAVALACGYDIVIRSVRLHRQPHRLDVIPCVAPVAPRLQQADGAERGHLSRVLRHVEAYANVALRAQVVDLVGLDHPQQPVQ